MKTISQKLVKVTRECGEYHNFINYGMGRMIEQGWILKFVIKNDEQNQIGIFVFETES